MQVEIQRTEVENLCNNNNNIIRMVGNRLYQCEKSKKFTRKMLTVQKSAILYQITSKS